MTVKLQSRDLDLIAVLDSHVKALSFEQVSRGWWGRMEDPKGSVSRRLRTLASGGHVSVFEAAAGPELDLAAPIIKVVAGESVTGLDDLQRVVSERSRQPTSKRRFVSTSGGRAAILADGSPDLATHELNFAALYLRLRGDVDGWRIVPSLFDSQVTAALDSEGVRYEVLCRPISCDQDLQKATRGAGLQVW